LSIFCCNSSAAFWRSDAFAAGVAAGAGADAASLSGTGPTTLKASLNRKIVVIEVTAGRSRLGFVLANGPRVIPKGLSGCAADPKRIRAAIAVVFVYFM